MSRLANRKTNYLDIPKTNFGEAVVVSPSPSIQFDAPYNILNPQVVESDTNGANSTVTASDGLVSLVNDGTAGAFAELKSRSGMIYRPGQSVSAKFTALFDTANATANYSQIAGAGNPENGFFVGINGTNGFGILHRKNGKREVRSLAITTAANAAANATITLNGANYTVALTNAGGANEFTCFEIEDGNAYGDIWIPQQVGESVIFMSTTAGPKSGSYAANFTTTGAAGSFSQGKAGVAATDTWVYKAAFNIDKLDGTGPSKMTLDETKLNVFEIMYGWLGASNILFSIQNPATGDIVPFHQISYTNQNTTPSLQNPQLEMYYRTEGDDAQTMKMASFNASVLGTIDNESLQYASAASKSTITTENPVLTIKNPQMFNSLSNHSLIRLNNISMTSSGGNAPVVFYLRKNLSLSAGTTSDYTNYSFVATQESCTLVDNTTDTFSGGQFIFAYQLGATDSLTVDVSNMGIKLRPGETLSVTATTSNATTAGVAINWSEDQ